MTPAYLYPLSISNGYNVKDLRGVGRLAVDPKVKAGPYIEAIYSSTWGNTIFVPWA